MTSIIISVVSAIIIATVIGLNTADAVRADRAAEAAKAHKTHNADFRKAETKKAA